MIPKKNLQQTNGTNSSNTRRFFTVLVILATIVFLIWIVWKTYQADNLGFKDKTLWDWMQLLVVPAVLALLVFWLNKSQKDTELKIAEMRRIEERESAEQRANVDREIERNRQQQKALEDYLDRMTDLLLKNKLRESSPSDEIRSIARTRTLTILRSLDGARKSQLIQFLYESSLIGRLNEQGFLEPILDLSFADLHQIVFEYANLSGICLPKANIRNTKFQGATLVGANFYNADLDDSDFSWAKLRGANLHAGLKRINLASASLDQANLENADLTGAKLWHTSFKGANLRYACFRNQINDLESATLMNVDFSGADLTKAIIDMHQLQGASSLSGAIMPNGEMFEEWEKKHSLRDKTNSVFNNQNENDDDI